MKIKVECLECGKRLEIPAKYQGKRVKCPDCDLPIRVPALRKSSSGSETSKFQSRNPKPSQSKIRRRPSNSKSNNNLIIIGSVIGGAVLFAAIGVVAYFALNSSVDKPVNNPDGKLSEKPPYVVNHKESTGPPTQTQLAMRKIPEFGYPELGDYKTLKPSGAKVYFVDFGTLPLSRESIPGTTMKMRVYIPPGDHKDKSLPCVLVAPAGSNLLRGNEMDNDDYHAETLPYVEAGMVVIFYSIDGPLKEKRPPQTASEAKWREYANAMQSSYGKFKRSYAGVVNGRNAFRFALSKLPMVDRSRVFSAGHSSAGVLSLLLATNLSGLRGSVAYAPATDVELRQEDILNDPNWNELLFDLKKFLKESSPKTHAGQLRCPVFLFHAEDDTNEPFKNTAAYAKLAKEKGANLTFSTVPTGNHYQSMIDEGIPRAIKWIKTFPSNPDYY